MDFRKPVRADRIHEKPIVYLWNDRLPRGEFSVVAGRPGKGKSFFVTHVAAAVSNNGGKVLFSSWENRPETRTKPALKAAGAILENIHVWKFTVPNDFAQLTGFVFENEIDLIVVDPFSAHLGSGVTRQSESLREKVLNPLSDMLRMTNSGMLIVNHVVKSVAANADPLSAIGGSSSGLEAAVQGDAYIMGPDPRDDDRYIVTCVKSNNADKLKSLVFEMDFEEIPVESGTDEIREVPKLVFDSEIEYDPMALLVTPSRPVGRPPDKRAAAAEWLTEYLVVAGGPVLVGTIKAGALAVGMSWKTCKRAADDLEIVKHPPGGGHSCTWDLPDGIKRAKGQITQEDVDKLLGDDDGAGS